MVEEGQDIGPGDLIAILEAMKLEVNVNAPENMDKAKVEKLLTLPGETINAGGRIALLKSNE